MLQPYQPCPICGTKKKWLVVHLLHDHGWSSKDFDLVCDAISTSSDTPISAMNHPDALTAVLRHETMRLLEGVRS
jgi:hypothetical protein